VRPAPNKELLFILNARCGWVSERERGVVGAKKILFLQFPGAYKKGEKAHQSFDKGEKPKLRSGGGHIGKGRSSSYFDGQ